MTESPWVGRRVRLVRCTDPWTRLVPGALGTVTHVDDLGTLHVRWDDGHTLGLVPGEDEWVVLETASDLG
jgi:hypothetical protein